MGVTHTHTLKVQETCNRDSFLNVCHAFFYMSVYLRSQDLGDESDKNTATARNEPLKSYNDELLLKQH